MICKSADPQLLADAYREIPQRRPSNSALVTGEYRAASANGRLQCSRITAMLISEYVCYVIMVSYG